MGGVGGEGKIPPPPPPTLYWSSMELQWLGSVDIFQCLNKDPTLSFKLIFLLLTTLTFQINFHSQVMKENPKNHTVSQTVRGTGNVPVAQEQK